MDAGLVSGLMFDTLVMKRVSLAEGRAGFIERAGRKA
jgi:hypothetical protein